MFPGHYTQVHAWDATRLDQTRHSYMLIYCYIFLVMKPWMPHKGTFNHRSLQAWGNLSTRVLAMWTRNTRVNPFSFAIRVLGSFTCTTNPRACDWGYGCWLLAAGCWLLALVTTLNNIIVLLSNNNTNNSGFLFSAQIRHSVTLKALQHYYPWSLGHSFYSLNHLSSITRTISGWREAIIVWVKWTQVSWPGFEPTFWWLIHQSRSPKPHNHDTPLGLQLTFAVIVGFF